MAFRMTRIGPVRGFEPRTRLSAHLSHKTPKDYADRDPVRELPGRAAGRASTIAISRAYLAIRFPSGARMLGSPMFGLQYCSAQLRSSTAPSQVYSASRHDSAEAQFAPKSKSAPDGSATSWSWRTRIKEGRPLRFCLVFDDRTAWRWPSQTVRLRAVVGARSLDVGLPESNYLSLMLSTPRLALLKVRTNECLPALRHCVCEPIVHYGVLPG